jgi:hypothetical protein
MKKLMLLAVCSSLILSSCSGSGKGDNVLCIVRNEDDDLSRCEDGQLLFFHQIGGGTGSLPLEVAALYCDFDHSIVYNNGGVVCKLDKKRWEKLVEAAKKN